MAELPEIDPENRAKPPADVKSKKSVLKMLGPGLITGAADDDPSGIATYSQAGAQFGYSTLWTMLVAFPLMTAVQLVSALIGRVTGYGIAANMRRHFPPAFMYFCVGLMLVANMINIGADIAAMGAAAQLVIGGQRLLYAAVFTVGSLLLQIFLQYTQYVKILKWLTLVLFAYVGIVFVVDVHWPEVLKGTFFPTISLHSDFLTVIAAIFGTTISPYLFFWQASEEVEEVKSTKEAKPLLKKPHQGAAEIHRIGMDTYIGMAVSDIIGFFIILTTATTLHANGKTDVQTAAQAAEALRPIAGEFAFLLFSLGIVGTGLLALPVLAGSASYAVGEILKWRTGLEAKPHRAKKFYALLSAIMLSGLALNLVHIDPIKALFWSAVINCIAAPPILVAMMLLASRADVMKQFVISSRLKIMGWIATALMTIVAIGSIVGWMSSK